MHDRIFEFQTTDTWGLLEQPTPPPSFLFLRISSTKFAYTVAVRVIYLGQLQMLGSENGQCDVQSECVNILWNTPSPTEHCYGSQRCPEDVSIINSNHKLI